MGAGGGPAGDDDEPGEPERQSVLSATPAADHTLSTATRLAGDSPVGSHHLLLAALTDANSAAAKILASLGVDLNQAKDALRDADVTGTSDEQPEEAGRRQMNIQVTGEMMMVVVTDETLVKSAAAALQALGKDKAPGATIRGADLQGAPAANLAKAWQSLHDALLAITTRAESESAPGAGDEGSAEDASSAGGVADPGAGEGGTGSPAA
ncbi:MAG TPA: Clp protease N-terminal domain-containing protein [Trebonia sp.]|nr:Clp protease N-terminal domain-containing protein [Trebonia sp.]